MSFLIELLVSICIIVGALIALLGSVGLLRFPDFFARLHAPTKSATLGVGALLVGAILLPLAHWRAPGFAEIMLTFFVFITAPVSANMLSLAAFRQAGEAGEAQADEGSLK
jgi:multicomponent K+:H+ antiporter subunit G